MTDTATGETYCDTHEFEIDNDPCPKWKRLRDEAGKT
jgi:hypothetical protein